MATFGGWRLRDRCDHLDGGRLVDGEVVELEVAGELPYVGVRWPDATFGRYLPEFLSPALDRPAGSAGSGSAVPPAAAAAAPVSSPAGAEPAGVTLLEAVQAALRAQGVLSGTELVARKAIRAGKVVVSGEVCRDPGRRVEPGDLE